MVQDLSLSHSSKKKKTKWINYKKKTKGTIYLVNRKRNISIQLYEFHEASYPDEYNIILII